MANNLHGTITESHDNPVSIANLLDGPLESKAQVVTSGADEGPISISIAHWSLLLTFQPFQ